MYCRYGWQSLVDHLFLLMVCALVTKNFGYFAARLARTYPVMWFLVGLSAVVALVGPFGTYQSLSLHARCAYWVPIILGAGVFVRLSNRLSAQITGTFTPLGQQLSAVLLFSVTFSPVVWAYSTLFSNDIIDVSSLMAMFADILAVALTVGTMVFFLVQNPAEVAAALAARPRLYARLPEGVAASIVRLSVDDHYVEVHLDDGTTHRVLMRLSDAVSEMDGMRGLTTHRSHWVVASHVTNGLRENNRDYLLLRSGTKIPVSRTYRRGVQAAGFL